MNTKRLKILQYNVNHGKESTIVPLLEDPKAHEFDIIAIQEPWRNQFATTSYCPSRTPFYLAYPKFEDTRVCCYINKRLNISSWNVTNHTADFQTITITPDDGSRQIEIHNIYNPSPYSYYSRLEGALTLLPGKLREDTMNIVLGDFNLHHPLWNGTERLTFHTAADTLLDIARDHSLSLVTPPGMTTWAERGSRSTIDLIFLSTTDHHKILRCTTRDDIAQSSDHLPVETTIETSTKPVATAQRRNWKNLDSEALLRALELANIPTTVLDTRERIDTTVQAITQEVTKAIDATIPWARSSSYNKSYWNTECTQAIIECRRAHLEHLRLNSDQSLELRRVARNRKIAAIRRAKRQEFRNDIAKVISSSEGL